MRRTLIATLLVVVPSIAFALDYTDISSQYTDAPFSRRDAAGISVLTNIGAVAGNPDGTFAPERTLNRAEFLKIALLASEAHVNEVRTSSGEGCFPDTPDTAWFTAYVCSAKGIGVVEGNPDGLFHPERPVNYVEALKILAILNGYSLPTPPDNERWAWYRQYILAAEIHEVAMDGIEPDHQLTRGEMARLAAAVVAEKQDELPMYRAFEAGQTVSSASSSTSSESSSSSTSSISSSSTSSFTSSSSSSNSSFMATSHFLLAGTKSPLLYDGVVQTTEDARIQSIQLELYREIKSFDSLMLYDEAGVQIGALTLQSYSNTNRTKWRVDITENGYVFPANTPVRVGVFATIKSIADGAISKELVEFKSIQIFVVGNQTSASQQLVPTDVHRPSHQTAFGRITGVRSVMTPSVTHTQGTQRNIGDFALSAQLATGATVKVTSIVFELQSTDVRVSNMKIGTSDFAQLSDCATEQFDSRTFVTCFLSESMQTQYAAPSIVSIVADVTVADAKQTGTVQLVSIGQGGINQIGAVNWTDTIGVFNWVESETEADSGPIVTVTK